MTTTGDVHTVTVRRTSLVRDDATYDIDHGDCTLQGSDCLVVQMLDELGVDTAILGASETYDRLADGLVVKVAPWASVYHGLGYGTGYDAGLDVYSVAARGRQVETVQLRGEVL